MKHWMKTWNGNALLAWLAVLAFAAAALWPRVFEDDIPLLGLRALSDLRIGVPLSLAALAMAVFLTVPAWGSRDGLLVCAGASLCLFGVVAYAVGASAALPFAFIGGNILRESRAARARSSSLWAETIR